MESLKKIISLSQAAKISGYTQDYLGYLIRQGEIKGVRKGRIWFTTEEEIKDYILKRKIRSQEFALKEFFSPTRTKKIIIIAILVFILIFFAWQKYHKASFTSVTEIKSPMISDGEAIKIN